MTNARSLDWNLASLWKRVEHPDDGSIDYFVRFDNRNSCITTLAGIGKVNESLLKAKRARKEKKHFECED